MKNGSLRCLRMIFVKSVTKELARQCLHPKLCNSFISALVAITSKFHNPFASTKMSLAFKIVKHGDNKHFVYVVDEKQLFGVLKPGKKATTYRCRNRKSNCKCTIKIKNGICTYGKNNIPHNHENNGEHDYLIVSAFNNIENEHDKAVREGKKLTARDLFNKAKINHINFNENKRRVRRRVQKARKNIECRESGILPEAQSTSINTVEENIETANETENITVLKDILVEPSTSIEINRNESMDLQNLCLINQIENLPIVFDEIMQSAFAIGRRHTQ